MYKIDPQLSMFSDPSLFDMGKGLDPENRWVKISNLVPWDVIEKKYAECFAIKGKGRPAKPARFALASHIIKEKFSLSDEETVDMIRENPYMQYMMGMPSYVDKRPFDPSTMVWFRKRMTPEMIAEVNEYIISGAGKNDDSNDESGGGSAATDGNEHSGGQEPVNKGTMILDATCTPADIKYPTDIDLLNEAREKLEKIIDQIHGETSNGQKKPRTYRKRARKDYLRFIRNRRPAKKLVRNQVRKQLGYVRRDLGYIEKMDVSILDVRQTAQLETIRKIYEQQNEMYQAGSHQVDDRIVSISQPHVRPIVRGKATANVEFGAKVAISMVDGYARVEKLSWDAFNEGGTLMDSAQRYKELHGYYPSRILADKIYRTRGNLAYCKSVGIAMSGPKLGRPPKDKKLYREQCLAERIEAGERNAVEGEFGTGKRKYGLDRIMARLKETSEVEIHMAFLSMNLWKRVRVSLALFFELLKTAYLSDLGIGRYHNGHKQHIMAAL